MNFVRKGLSFVCSNFSITLRISIASALIYFFSMQFFNPKLLAPLEQIYFDSWLSSPVFGASELRKIRKMQKFWGPHQNPALAVAFTVSLAVLFKTMSMENVLSALNWKPSTTKQKVDQLQYPSDFSLQYPTSSSSRCKESPKCTFFVLAMNAFHVIVASYLVYFALNFEFPAIFRRNVEKEKVN
ncbi:unnamed protein product [Caenorhabditis auriculariae]|uniref:Uncharacterized protein n=1 Tax=Caenorhabditis auriculariae TaxID=2777116 RepID=A0A8S1HRE8_9PELO|nr:unnamed protein product [Caenorhabditis auriculariae]